MLRCCCYVTESSPQDFVSKLPTLLTRIPETQMNILRVCDCLILALTLTLAHSLTGFLARACVRLGDTVSRSIPLQGRQPQGAEHDGSQQLGDCVRSFDAAATHRVHRVVAQLPGDQSGRSTDHRAPSDQVTDRSLLDSAVCLKCLDSAVACSLLSLCVCCCCTFYSLSLAILRYLARYLQLTLALPLVRTSTSSHELLSRS